MVRNILNELIARGVRHLIISALFFVVYALCGTTIMLTVLFLIDRHTSGESVDTRWSAGFENYIQCHCRYEQALCRLRPRGAYP